MIRRGALLAALLAAAAGAQPKSSTWLTTNFQARSHASAEVTLVYRLFKPVGYDSTKKYPIVVALHGGGERGSDNSIQLTREELAQPWVRDSVQAKHPHFVMIPQCPANLAWSPSAIWDGNRSLPNIGIVQILDSLKREFSLDTTRFYVVGLSMGGFASFELMKWTPHLFAAAVPTAGGGDTAAPAIAQMIKTPMWAFHSLSDPTVSAQRGSRTLVSKMEAALGKPIPRFVSDTGMKNPAPFDSAHGVITVDSLRKLVYVDSAHFLYSEVRNVPGTGNPLHQAGWFIAWRHPMLTDWLFSKRKINGVTGLVNPAVVSAKQSAPHVRLVLTGNRMLLERKTAGAPAFYTLEGKRLPAGTSR